GGPGLLGLDLLFLFLFLFLLLLFFLFHGRGALVDRGLGGRFGRRGLRLGRGQRGEGRAGGGRRGLARELRVHEAERDERRQQLLDGERLGGRLAGDLLGARPSVDQADDRLGIRSQAERRKLGVEARRARERHVGAAEVLDDEAAVARAEE